MPTQYLYATILTGQAVAANNRGDNLGNTTTLQKVFLGDDLHTSVSAEAIRFAIRYRFQLEGLQTNRTYDQGSSAISYVDVKREKWSPKESRIDDDLMGFMDAQAAKQEQEAQGDDTTDRQDNTAKKSQKSKERPDGPTVQKSKQNAVTAPPKTPKSPVSKRQSPLAVGRAVSLRPYRGELSFNCVSGVKAKGALSLYAAEMHTTEYQYTLGLNLDGVLAKQNIAHLIDAIADMPPVAGNHARFSYDFSPESIILRLTHCHSPKIQNCFEHDGETRGWSLHKLLARVRSNDVPSGELVIGGLVADTEFGRQLREEGCSVFPGVLQAAQEIKRRIASYGDPFDVVLKSAEGRQNARS